MSEYQYYEFLAVDRALTADQISELRELSTRARITPTSFVNTYNWGDFRGDPDKLMAEYFDAFCYVANWGTRRLMFRLPARLLDLDTALRYCRSDSARAWAAGEHVIIELTRDADEGSWEDEDGEGWLASMIPARAELARGDLRLLYLAWLHSAELGELDDDELEPPVPPNLATLPASLDSVMNFLSLDDLLVAVAAEASEELATVARPDTELASWVASLPAAEKDATILRMIQGDDAGVRMELLRRFHADPVHGDPVHTDPVHGEPGPSGMPAPRTVGELLDDAAIRNEERDQRNRERLEQERLRQERETQAARGQHLDGLEREGEQAWQRVTALIETKKIQEYDVAVILLADLRDLGQRQGQPEHFAQRLQGLRQRYANRPGLLSRLDRADLVATPTGSPT